MKYINLIKQVFNKFNLKPRQKQLQIINNILLQFIDNNKQNVILSASTGAGKSIIAVIVTQCLYKLLNDTSFNNGKAYILMNTNTLVNQYHNTFQSYNEFLNLKGKNNYDCDLFNSTADICVYGNKKTRQLMTQNMLKYCNQCLYNSIKKRIYTTPYIITNYNYYFTALNTKNKSLIKPTLMTVFDQCHLLNNIYCSTYKIVINQKVLVSLSNIVKKYIVNYQVIKNDKRQKVSNLRSRQSLLKRIQTLQILLSTLTQKTYVSFLQELNNIYQTIRIKLQIMNEVFYSQSQFEQYKTYSKIINALLNNKIKSFIEMEYEHVVDIQPSQITIEPIFLKSIYHNMKNSKYNLFMSATINPNYLISTMDLDIENTGFIKTDSFFPKESKKVILINHESYNYSKMKDQKFIEQMCSIIYNIILQHPTQSGIILTPSFAMNEQIMFNIYGKQMNQKIFVHEQSTNLNDILQQFKMYNNPSILISPSLFQGIDLYGDLSTFQILVKAPYATLNNKRTKYILQIYPKIYKQQTLFKIIQGFGRSTRRYEDNSITYCLDTNIERLFYSEQNLWKEQFDVYTL